MKKPVLAVGILMFIIFLMQPTTRKWLGLEGYDSPHIPSTCRVIKEWIAPKAPSHWNFECADKDSLVVTIQIEGKGLVDKKLKQEMYKVLANAYVQLAGWSNLETYEMLQRLTVVAEYNEFSIITKTTGQSAAGFAGLSKQEDISNRLRAHVGAKEVIKR